VRGLAVWFGMAATPTRHEVPTPPLSINLGLAVFGLRSAPSDGHAQHSPHCDRPGVVQLVTVRPARDERVSQGRKKRSASEGVEHLEECGLNAYARLLQRLLQALIEVALCRFL
jgi:hypothetical protein